MSYGGYSYYGGGGDSGFTYNSSDGFSTSDSTLDAAYEAGFNGGTPGGYQAIDSAHDAAYLAGRQSSYNQPTDGSGMPTQQGGPSGGSGFGSGGGSSFGSGGGSSGGGAGQSNPLSSIASALGNLIHGITGQPTLQNGVPVATGTGPTNPMTQLLPLLLIGGVAYFVLSKKGK